jgi:hypothetical protein
VGTLAWRALQVSAEVEGIEDGGSIRRSSLADLTVAIRPSEGDVEDARLEFDGVDVTGRAAIAAGWIRWKPGSMADGEHTITLHVPRSLLPDATLRWRFDVDGVPPTILVPPYLPPRPPDKAVTFEGSVEGARELRANGEVVDVDGDGHFRLSYAAPPPGPIELVARDDAGNVRRSRVYAPIPYPEVVRGVHVTALAWKHAGLRQGVVDLVNAGAVNTVVLTLKDEGGLVGHTTKVALARRIGANQDLYDLERQVEFLHSKGIHVTGRIVAFRDPVLADHAWSSGERAMVIQSPDGERFGTYGGGFTNFSHPVVQEYNIALAEEAVRAGVDDILYDYVRRPDGFIEDMVIPGLEGDPQAVISDFLATSHTKMRAMGAYQGASVFGVAATRPEQISQNVLEMASHTDYIAPMLYPSHWNDGEYGVPAPESQPYEIVSRSLRDFQQQVNRTGRPLVPWLQHFSLRVRYGPDEVRAQVRAAREAGIRSWMLWDPAVTYGTDLMKSL